MGFFDKFPYSNFQELNLDWIISKIKTVETSKDEAVASAAAAKQSEDNAAASEQNAADSESAAAGSASAAAESAEGIEAAREQIYLNTQRLDNLIVDGQQTEGNTELLDIRVGYDGTIYDTAGDAVRDQVSDLNQVLNDISYETSKLSFAANDEIAELPVPFTKGLATRYPVEGDIKKVRAYCYLIGNTSSIDVICEIKKGDFSSTLGSKTISAAPQNYGQYFDFVFDTPIRTSEENVYICIYSTEATAKIGSSTGSFDTCTATETYKNRYMDFESGSWFTVNNISNYCLYVWVYRPAYKEKNGGIIFVGQDESCDYSTIQAALDGCNDSASNPIVIFIKNGTYDPISFTDSGRGLRYISLIGESRENVIIYGDKGKYELPTAEIRTVGAIKNITFIQKTSQETYEPGGQYNYCYAVHDDFDGSNVEYDNCSFISNAGPAVGLGTRANLMKVFRNCYFELNGDGTYGNITLGAFYCHSYWENAENQGLIIENCTAINRYGDYGIRLDKLSGYIATFNANVRNSWSFGRNGASALNTFNITDSFGNNVPALNNM